MKHPKSVHLVGFAGGFDKVPWTDPAWEVWGFNQMYRMIPPSRKYRFTRWFELHTPDYFVKDIYGNASSDTWEKVAGELDALSQPLKSWTLQTMPHVGAAKRAIVMAGLSPSRPAIPVYLPAKDKLVPRARVYPRKAVERLTPHGAYHAGSFDWMVALAILEKFQRITITGVNFANGGEPISARPCLEYWCGVAEARGIEVRIIGGDCFHIFHQVKSDVPYGFAPWQLVEDRT